MGRPIPRQPSYARRGFAYGYGGGGFGIASYPVFIGGYGSDYYSGYGDPAMAGAPAPAPAPAPPPVVINQYFGDPSQGAPIMGGPAEPSMQVYPQQQQVPQPTAAPTPAPEPRSYLIALKDHSVVSALAYWVEDRTLHYVTPQNTHNQADLSLVDIDFTRKLNQDRNMSFTVGQ